MKRHSPLRTATSVGGGVFLVNAACVASLLALPTDDSIALSCIRALSGVLSFPISLAVWIQDRFFFDDVSLFPDALWLVLYPIVGPLFWAGVATVLSRRHREPNEIR